MACQELHAECTALIKVKAQVVGSPGVTCAALRSMDFETAPGRETLTLTLRDPGEAHFVVAGLG